MSSLLESLQLRIAALPHLFWLWLRHLNPSLFHVVSGKIDMSPKWGGSKWMRTRLSPNSWFRVTKRSERCGEHSACYLSFPFALLLAKEAKNSCHVPDASAGSVSPAESVSPCWWSREVAPAGTGCGHCREPVRGCERHGRGLAGRGSCAYIEGRTVWVQDISQSHRPWGRGLRWQGRAWELLFWGDSGAALFEAGGWGRASAGSEVTLLGSEMGLWTCSALSKALPV